MKPDPKTWFDMGKELAASLTAFKENDRASCRQSMAMAQQYINLIMEWAKEDDEK